MNLTIEEVMQLVYQNRLPDLSTPTVTPTVISTKTHPFVIGKNYFIRTVTHNYTGRLVEVHPTELVLEDAAWIADSGRFMQAIADGTLNEVEPFPKGRQVIIGRGAIVDATQIEYSLPCYQK